MVFELYLNKAFKIHILFDTQLHLQEIGLQKHLRTQRLLSKDIFAASLMTLGETTHLSNSSLQIKYDTCPWLLLRTTMHDSKDQISTLFYIYRNKTEAIQLHNKASCRKIRCNLVYMKRFKST